MSTTASPSLLIGCAAGFSGDRRDLAACMTQHGFAVAVVDAYAPPEIALFTRVLATLSRLADVAVRMKEATA